MTYYLHKTVNVIPGRLKKYTRLWPVVDAIEKPVLEKRKGCSVGGWTTVFGNVNHAFHLLSYEALSDVEAVVQELDALPGWREHNSRLEACRDWVDTMVLQRIISFPDAKYADIMMSETERLYIHRIIELRPNMRERFISYLADIDAMEIPVMSKYGGKVHGHWATCFGRSDYVLSLSSYHDFSSRDAVVKELRSFPQWSEKFDRGITTCRKTVHMSLVKPIPHSPKPSLQTLSQID
ncbi:MAG: NIPSNAP family protein [Chloroflexota bacterium]